MIPVPLWDLTLRRSAGPSADQQGPIPPSRPWRGGNYVRIFVIGALDILPQAAQCWRWLVGWGRLNQETCKEKSIE
jgi:hypothetical protein